MSHRPPVLPARRNTARSWRSCLVALALAALWHTDGVRADERQSGAPDVAAAAPDAAADEAAFQARQRTERARIAAQRKQLESRFTKEQADCQHRFGVTDCMNRVRAVRHTELTDLQRQEVLLADEERRRRAGARVERLDEKAAEFERSRREQQELPERVPNAPAGPAAGKLPRDKAASNPDIARERANEEAYRAKQQRHAEEAAKRAERASRSAEEEQRFEARQREAAQYKERVLRRQAERQRSDKPPAAPLPPLPPS